MASLCFPATMRLVVFYVTTDQSIGDKQLLFETQNGGKVNVFPVNESPQVLCYSKGTLTDTVPLDGWLEFSSLLQTF